MQFSTTPKLPDFASVLPRAILDDTRQLSWFGRDQLLPYAGTGAASNHAYATLLEDLTLASPSRSAVHGDLIEYGYSGDLGVVRRNTTGFAFRRGEIVAKEQERYADWLLSLGLNGAALVADAREGERATLNQGWACILVDFSKVGGEPAVQMRTVGVSHAVLTADMRNVVYFPSGTRSLSDGRDHYVYPIGAKPGSPRCAFPLGNGAGPYGRPYDIGSLRPMLTEALQWRRLERIADTAHAAAFAIASPIDVVSEDNVQAGSDDAQDPRAIMAGSMRQVLKTEGIGILDYVGDQPPKVLRFDINRDYKYDKTVASFCENAIYSANRWSPELTGARAVQGGIGSSHFKDLVRHLEAKVIVPRQSRRAAHQNEALNWVAKACGQDWALEYRHAFASPSEWLGLRDDQTENTTADA